MKTIIIFVLTFSFSLQAFATFQAPDRLIYKGDTIPIFALPLNEHPDFFDSLWSRLFGDKEEKDGFFTYCWRGYEATWEIIDDQLYLIEINSCWGNLKSNLTELFGGKCIDGKVKADWFTGEMLSPQGEVVYDLNCWNSAYERELGFYFETGTLIKTDLYDNSKSKKSIYSQDLKLVYEHIDNNIRKKILPQVQDSIFKIVVRFSANEDGIIDDVKIIEGYNDIYDQELIRVIKTIPEWSVYIKKGKLIRNPCQIPVTFRGWNRLYLEL